MRTVYASRVTDLLLYTHFPKSTPQKWKSQDMVSYVQPFP